MKKKGKILPTLFNVGAFRRELNYGGGGGVDPYISTFQRNFLGEGNFFNLEILVRGWPGCNLFQYSHKPSPDLFKASLQRITQRLASSFTTNGHPVTFLLGLYNR